MTIKCNRCGTINEEGQILCKGCNQLLNSDNKENTNFVQDNDNNYNMNVDFSKDNGYSSENVNMQNTKPVENVKKSNNILIYINFVLVSFLLSAVADFVISCFSSLDSNVVLGIEIVASLLVFVITVGIVFKNYCSDTKHTNVLLIFIFMTELISGISLVFLDCMMNHLPITYKAFYSSIGSILSLALAINYIGYYLTSKRDIKTNMIKIINIVSCILIVVCLVIGLYFKFNSISFTIDLV